MEDIKFAPTKAQISKLLKSKAVQLKPEQIGYGVKLHPAAPDRVKKQLKKAQRLRKGARIMFSPQELEGEGFMDFLKSLGSAFTKPFRALAPVLKPVAKAIAPVVAPIIASKTGIPVTADILEKGVDVVGNLAGVGMKRGGAMVSRKVSRNMLADDYNTLMSARHPVFGDQTPLPAHDMTGAVQSAMARSTAPKPQRLVGKGFKVDVAKMNRSACTIPVQKTDGGMLPLLMASMLPGLIGSLSGNGIQPRGSGFRAAGY